MQTDPTYLEEPRIALAPGALGGLVITASVREPYADTTAALTLVRDRLPMVTDVAWDRATIALHRVGKRHRYTLFVPPLVGTPGPGLSADEDPASASLPLAGGTPEDAARADVAMRDAIAERLRLAGDRVPEEIREDVCTAFACLARWSLLSAGDRRSLYGLSQRLMERSSVLSHSHPPVEE